MTYVDALNRISQIQDQLAALDGTPASRDLDERLEPGGRKLRRLHTSFATQLAQAQAVNATTAAATRRRSGRRDDGGGRGARGGRVGHHGAAGGSEPAHELPAAVRVPTRVRYGPRSRRRGRVAARGGVRRRRDLTAERQQQRLAEHRLHRLRDVRRERLGLGRSDGRGGRHGRLALGQEHDPRLRHGELRGPGDPPDRRTGARRRRSRRSRARAGPRAGTPTCRGSTSRSSRSHRHAPWPEAGSVQPPYPARREPRSCRSPERPCSSRAPAAASDWRSRCAPHATARTSR